MTNKAPKTQQATPEPTPLVEDEQHVDGSLPPGLTLTPGDLPGHATAGQLRRRVVAQHQSRHGNRALQRLLQRDTPAVPAVAPSTNTGLDPSMFRVTVMAAPASTGHVTVTKHGEGADGFAEVQAPMIKGEYGVSLDPSVSLGSGSLIKVGPVQTMTSSERVGIYKKDGKVVAEYRFTLGQTRDARPLAYKPGEPTFLAEPPFYDRPQDMSDGMPSVTVNFVDRPSMRLPLEFGGGRLAGLRGADRFNTSVGAKRDGKVITMSPFGWAVDWTTELGEDFSVPTDANGNPLSKGVNIWDEKQGIAIDSPTAASDLLKRTDPIFSFKTLDSALATPTTLLLVGLPAARRSDPASAALMEQALIQKRPTIQILITAVKPATHNYVLADSDTLEMFASVSKQSATKGPFVFEAGHSHAADLALSEVADVGAINESSSLSVWIGGTHGSAVLGETAEFPVPFVGTKTLRLAGTDRVGEYTVKANINS